MYMYNIILSEDKLRPVNYSNGGATSYGEDAFIN